MGIDAYNHTVSGDKAVTLNAASGDSPTHSGPSVMVYGISAYDSNSMKSPNPNSGIYKAETARTLDLNGGSPACNQGGMAVVSMATKQLSQNIGDNVAMPICANDYKEPQVVCLEGNGQRPSHQGNGYAEGETMYTLNSTEHHAVCFDARGNGNGQIAPTITGDHQDRITDYTAIAVGEVAAYKEAQMIAYGIDRAAYNQGKNALYDFSVEEEKIATQVAKGPGAVCAAENCQKVECIVRRLTPMECERLQGYPDGWTNIGDWTDSKGKTHKGDSDAPRYKALGNSIALPFWEWMAKRMTAYITDHKPTMASLFDGIGGFPLVFNRSGADPIWASEIEEFPIAVTKIRFPEKEEE